MKDEINLLPPPLLAARLRQLFVERLTHLGSRGILYLGMVSAVLLAIWVGELAVARVLGEQLEEAGHGDASLEESVRSTNAWLNEFAQRADQHPPWTPLLRQLLVGLPGEIKLTSLQITSQPDALQIRATASSRAAVIAWQRQLEAMPAIAKVESPLQNFATGPIVDFLFTLTRRVPAHE